MKHTILLLFILCLSVSGFAQKKKKTKEPEKCKVVYNKELDMEVYENLDYSTSPTEWMNDSIFLSDSFKFKGDFAKYKDDQKVRFAYRVDIDGVSSLIKVLDPKDDKEVEDEARRIVTLLPRIKPATCDGQVVPSVGYMTMPLKPKTKSESH